MTLLNTTGAIIPKRVILDTNVCLDLFVFHDPRWARLLSALKTGHIQAFTRQDCREEWLVVLRYPHLPISSDQLTGIELDFDQLIQCVAPEQKQSLILPRCTDKDDQKFLEVARDINADILITKDKALLKLAKKTQKAGLFFIQTPDKFLQSWNVE